MKQFILNNKSNKIMLDPNKVEFDLKTKSLNTISKSDEKKRLSKWVITNINGDFINYECPSKEVK